MDMKRHMFICFFMFMLLGYREKEVPNYYERLKIV